MRKALILSGALAIVAPSLAAQTVRWNDRPSATWADEAPRVRITIEGPRAVSYGAPMRIRFEVSDNAYVTVVRVDDDGRMTILFPYSRNQRAAARGGQVHYVRNPRFGNNVSFFANDRMGGYVFALATYAPLDFSTFENRDYDRAGGWSRFTQANRSIARRPDVFIDRFAAAVLWDVNTPYDYDVDYYFPQGYPGMFNAYALCGTSAFGYDLGWRTSLAQFSSWDRMAYPYSFMCRDWYSRLQCYSWMAFYGYSACRNVGIQVATGPTVPVGGQPADTTWVPNEGVVRGGLFTPTPVPVGAGPEPPPAERPAGRFDRPGAGGNGAAWDGVLSIPERATRKMKEEDARRELDTKERTTPARAGFDRADASKPEKVRTADADAVTRAQPPSREPTKAKGASEPRRETTRNRGFGSTGRPLEPRSVGPERVSRPSEPKTTATPANPPSIKGTTTEKKKPPLE
jgi:hypothetical protein